MYKVLLVEDEEMILKHLQFSIDWGAMHCVICGTAANGREGAQEVRNLKPDIIITDIRMPYMDGIQMLEATRDVCAYQTIILSGYEEFAYAQSAIALGVTQYLLKPVDVQELKEALQKVFRRLEEQRMVRRLQSGEEKASRPILPEQEGSYASRRVNKMVQFIREHYGEKISIKDISDEMELSVSYLHSLFRENTGYTFNDFLNRYRIQKAVQYMQTTQMKIYEIAQAVGIPDYKYFNHVFKKYTGWSPTGFTHPEE